MSGLFPIIGLTLILCLNTLDIVNTLAQPKSFTDDPFIDDEKFTEKVVKHEVVGVVGEKVAIPCNCTPTYSRAGDKPALILWYKDKAKMPIYSFDLRSQSESGKHWKDDRTLGNRGYVFYEEIPHSCKSYLNIEPVIAGDSGQYRCRVDFEISPTRNTRIKLKLIARPTKPVIYSDDGIEVTHRTKPVRIGSDLKLYCISQGGDPAPSLTWRRANVPMAAASQDVDSLSGRITSTMVITALSQSDQGAAVTCTADNSALVQPQSASVILDVIVPPVRAKIIREWNYFTADTTYNVTCQVLGSRPSALTHMWVGPKPLKTIFSQVGDDGNVCTSVMEFNPKKEDDQKFLSCQARNELIDDIAVEDQWKITVYYKPEVWLFREGRNNNSIIKLGDDVTLKCAIVANPGHHTIVWQKQNHNLEDSPAPNVHLLDETLFINSWTDDDNGDYRCEVTNQAGTTQSNSVKLSVAAAPNCDSNVTKVVTLHEGQDLFLECKMSWMLSSDIAFSWIITANDATGNYTPVQIATDYIEHRGNTSILRLPSKSFVGVSEGSVRCEAAAQDNGESGQPCRYQIRYQDGADILLVCNIFNQTFSSFTVDCSKSTNLEATSQISFQFEVRNIHSGAIIRNVSSSSPRLTLKGLPSASDYIINVYSYFGGKRSKAYTLEGFTTRPGEKQLATMPEMENKNPLRLIPVLGGFLLISLLLVLITITIVAIIRRKMTGARNSPSQQLELLSSSGSVKRDTMETIDSMDYSPDIIPKDGGYGYCQSIEDLRHNKEISSEVMTTELLLDNSNTISHDNQVSAFKRPESYYAELSFGKFTGDTFKIPNFEKTRHNTASSTSTEYAQILSAPNDQTFFENGESVKYIDVDKSEVPNESDFKANGQDESISVFLCKVAKQNQVFHKYKPEASKSFRCEFLEKNNSIERLNSSLSSDIMPTECLDDMSQIYTISRVQNDQGSSRKRVKFEDQPTTSTSSISEVKKPGENLQQKNTRDGLNHGTSPGAKVPLCSMHKHKLDKNISG